MRDQRYHTPARSSYRVIYLWLLLPDKFDLQTQATRMIDLFFDQLPAVYLTDWENALAGQF